ncbi:hypothetical protein ACFONL_01340 [Camelimonas fluminis]|uniref:Lipid A 3-O-deacylase PagL n=1 Tax=Camelimonas fluminis TaxID=1576911 RepID=A0ABV7UBQ2_9HYPH|nr:hypothetical protein [Camelimonas fluminis]
MKHIPGAGGGQGFNFSLSLGLIHSGHDMAHNPYGRCWGFSLGFQLRNPV